jgi:hypothetical protein
MRERLLLDGIDAETGRAPVGREDEAVVLARPHEAEAPLPFREAALARAQVALDPPVVEPGPPARGMPGFMRGDAFGHDALAGSPASSANSSHVNTDRAIESDQNAPGKPAFSLR